MSGTASLYPRSYAHRRTWGPAGAPADFGGKAPAQKGYEAYLDMLQQRNRSLRLLKEKDAAAHEREQREKGFSTYVNGSNKARNEPSKPRGRRRQPLRVNGSRAAPSPTRVGAGRASHLHPRQPTPQPPANRGRWQISPSFKIRTTDGEDVPVVAPAVLSGQYDDDFESCSDSGAVDTDSDEESERLESDDVDVSVHGSPDETSAATWHSAADSAVSPLSHEDPAAPGEGGRWRMSPFAAAAEECSADEIDEEDLPEEAERLGPSSTQVKGVDTAGVGAAATPGGGGELADGASAAARRPPSPLMALVTRARTTSPGQRRRRAMPELLRPHSASAPFSPRPLVVSRPLTASTGKRVVLAPTAASTTTPRTPRRFASAAAAPATPYAVTGGASAAVEGGQGRPASGTPSRGPVQPWRGALTSPAACQGTAGAEAEGRGPKRLPTPPNTPPSQRAESASAAAAAGEAARPTSPLERLIARPPTPASVSQATAAARPGTAVIRSAPVTEQRLEVVIRSAWGHPAPASPRSAGTSPRLAVGLAELELRGPNGFVPALGPSSVSVDAGGGSATPGGGGEEEDERGWAAAGRLVSGRGWTSDPSRMWVTEAPARADGRLETPIVIAVTLPGDFALHGVKLWNYNAPGATEYGARDVEVRLGGQAVFQGELPMAPGRDSRQHGFLVPLRPPSAAAARTDGIADPAGVTSSEAHNVEEGAGSGSAAARPSSALWLPDPETPGTPQPPAQSPPPAASPSHRESISSAGRNRAVQDINALITASLQRPSPAAAADGGGEPGTPRTAARRYRRGSAGGAATVPSRVSPCGLRVSVSAPDSESLHDPAASRPIRQGRGGRGSHSHGAAPTGGAGVAAAAAGGGVAPAAPAAKGVTAKGKRNRPQKTSARGGRHGAAAPRSATHREPAPAPGAPFSIPLLPRGRELELQILSTWGDPGFVGLAGLDLFDQAGREVVHFESVVSEPPAPLGGGYVSAAPSVLVNGVNLTTDREQMWLAKCTGDNRVTLRFAEPTTLALVRVWNYNASRGSSYAGAREVVMRLDGKVVFAGEISKAPGAGSPRDPGALGEPILFTVDPEILGQIARVDRALACGPR